MPDAFPIILPGIPNVSAIVSIPQIIAQVLAVIPGLRTKTAVPPAGIMNAAGIVNASRVLDAMGIKGASRSGNAAANGSGGNRLDEEQCAKQRGR